MTDKHIPANKLLALQRYDGRTNEDDSGKFIYADDLRALIDEAPEVEPLDYVHNMPGAPGFTVCVFKAERVPCFTPIYLAPPPSPDLTKLVGELVEFVNEVNNWLVCAPIASPDDMAQSFDSFQKQCDALLTRAKEYLK